MSGQFTLAIPDLMKEFRAFINASSTRKYARPSIELTRTALNLIKHLPACRPAVLQYLKSVFDTAALNHIMQIEQEINTGKPITPDEYEEAMLIEVHNLLHAFVSANAESWAPIISTWSLELLGEISSHFSSRAQITCLNESLQLWMNCKATKLLLDLTTQCLSCLMHSNTEACINALLDTSVKHSPYFDWVVAHVGSCFPQTVIERVLSCGLKDFTQNKSYRQGIDSPKLKSVVGILGHLTTSHSRSVQTALLELFQLCYQEKTDNSELNATSIKAIVPFLMQILILSDKILNAVCDNVKGILTVEIIMKLYNMSNDWFRYFGSSDDLQEIIVNLIMKCSRGGEQILELLLKCIALRKNRNSSKYAAVSNRARGLLESVLEELDYNIRFYSASHKSSVNFLNSLIYDVQYVHQLLLNDDDFAVQTAARICIYVGAVNPPMLIQGLSFLLQNAKQPKHLAYLVRILNNELIDKNTLGYAEKGGHFAVILQQILGNDFVGIKGCASELAEVHKYEQMWQNILLLLRWERNDDVFMLKSNCISKGIEYNMTELSGIFQSKALNSKCSHLLCEILDLLDIPNKNSYQIPLQVILNYVDGVVKYFFLCCSETDEILRISGFKRVHRILKNLSHHSKISRNLALRLLLERSLFSKDAALFGAKIEDNNNATDLNKHLITQNKKISKTIHLTKHSSVYNGGIIGNGKRKSISVYRPPIDLVAGNTEQLIVAIKKCCSAPGDKSDVQLESLTLISLMLVQLISPDVMYNGLPWPEEDFSKVTIERDLLIRRLFNTKPLLWDLLNLVALNRPSLCYCSVLLRALTATLIHQWTSMGDQSKSSNTESYKDLMSTTTKVIDVMALGQLLPAPLCNIRDVISHLNSQEIVLILRECIWCYMRDHIPSPALFCVDANGLHWRDPKVVKPPEVYTRTLRTIMQRNIMSVGHLYARMFISAQNDNS